MAMIDFDNLSISSGSDVGFDDTAFEMEPSSEQPVTEYEDFADNYEAYNDAGDQGEYNYNHDTRQDDIDYVSGDYDVSGDNEDVLYTENTEIEHEEEYNYNYAYDNAQDGEYAQDQKYNDYGDVDNQEFDYVEAQDVNTNTEQFDTQDNVYIDPGDATGDDNENSEWNNLDFSSYDDAADDYAEPEPPTSTSATATAEMEAEAEIDQFDLVAESGDGDGGGTSDAVEYDYGVGEREGEREEEERERKKEEEREREREREEKQKKEKEKEKEKRRPKPSASTSTEQLTEDERIFLEQMERAKEMGKGKKSGGGLARTPPPSPGKLAREQEEREREREREKKEREKEREKEKKEKEKKDRERERKVKQAEKMREKERSHDDSNVNFESLNTDSAFPSGKGGGGGGLKRTPPPSPSIAQGQREAMGGGGGGRGGGGLKRTPPTSPSPSPTTTVSTGGKEKESSSVLIDINAQASGLGGGIGGGGGGGLKRTPPTSPLPISSPSVLEERVEEEEEREKEEEVESHGEGVGKGEDTLNILRSECIRLAGERDKWKSIASHPDSSEEEKKKKKKREEKREKGEGEGVEGDFNALLSATENELKKALEQRDELGRIGIALRDQVKEHAAEKNELQSRLDAAEKLLETETSRLRIDLLSSEEHCLTLEKQNNTLKQQLIDFLSQSEERVKVKDAEISELRSRHDILVVELEGTRQFVSKLQEHIRGGEQQKAMVEKELMDRVLELTQCQSSLRQQSEELDITRRQLTDSKTVQNGMEREIMKLRETQHYSSLEMAEVSSRVKQLTIQNEMLSGELSREKSMRLECDEAVSIMAVKMRRAEEMLEHVKSKSKLNLNVNMNMGMENGGDSGGNGEGVKTPIRFESSVESEKKEKEKEKENGTPPPSTATLHTMNQPQAQPTTYDNMADLERKRYRNHNMMSSLSPFSAPAPAPAPTAAVVSSVEQSVSVGQVEAGLGTTPFGTETTAQSESSFSGTLEGQLMKLNQERDVLQGDLSRMRGNTISIRKKRSEMEAKLEDLEHSINSVKRQLRAKGKMKHGASANNDWLYG